MMITLKKIPTLLQLFFYDFFKISHSEKDFNLALDKAVNWLCMAQDSTPNGGVSEGYHLRHGWLPSYPETTGYIIETLYDYSKLTNNTNLRNRSVEMANWLVDIQYEDGSIPDSYFKKKMVFDTGQVLFGFVRAFEETGEKRFKVAALKAGDWLIDVQEDIGTWRKYAVREIAHTYYARVAWSLTRLHYISNNDRYIEGCKRNIDWVLSQQQENGWFDNAAFTQEGHAHPYTHTIAYTIRGVLESGIYLQRNDYIDAARKAMDGLLNALPEDGEVCGAYDKNWNGNSHFSCLTGNSQLAIIFFKLYQLTGIDNYLSTGKRINNFMLSKQEMRTNNKNIYGAIAGSYPVWGEYIHYMYPNWAVKFFIDSLLLERKIMS